MIPVPVRVFAPTPESMPGRPTRTPGAHQSTIAQARNIPRVPPVARQVLAKSGPCRATEPRGTPNLAFHARLIELALQAGNAAAITGAADSTISQSTPPRFASDFGQQAPRVEMQTSPLSLAPSSENH